MGSISERDGQKRKKHSVGKRVFPFCLAAFIAGAGVWFGNRRPEALEVSVLAPLEDKSYAQEIRVELAGAVMYPGVYSLPNAAQVKDGISLAGGFTNAADKCRLNMEDALFDRERLYVPAQGEDVVSLVSYRDLAEESEGPVDLNAATTEELESLPGVGEAIAKSIVAYRNEHGRFTRVEDLLLVDRIGESLLERLSGLVTVE